MSRRWERQTGFPGVLVDRARGIVFDWGTTVPADASVGYAPGCIYIDVDAAAGSQGWINEGTSTSSAFKAISSSSTGTFTNATITNATITNATITNATVTNATATNATVTTATITTATVTNSTQTNAAITNATITNGSLASTMTLANLTNFVLGTGSGTRVGTAANQKLGLFGVTPVIQPAGTGEAAGVGAGNGATNANLANVNFTGNSGNSAYTIGDVVKALKQVGVLTA